MRAITVTEWEKTPTLKSDSPLPPKPEANQTQVRILASALAQLIRSQSSGKHYSVQEATLPYVPGVDGVGLTVPDNRLVHFNSMSNKPVPGGALADYITVDSSAVKELPDLGNASDQMKTATAVKVAALMNPAMSSWMAMKRRAHVNDFAAEGREWNVLILGVTSASGRLAALQARHLGASKVIGVARSGEQLETLKQRGVIDIAIPLNKEDPASTEFTMWRQVFPHVILDYIYGSVAAAVLKSIPHSSRQADIAEARYVHIGALSRELTFPLEANLLRSTNITISGAGPGAWSLKALTKETPAIIENIVKLVPDEGWEEEYGISKRSLEDVQAAYDDTKARNVFVMVDQ